MWCATWNACESACLFLVNQKHSNIQQYHQFWWNHRRLGHTMNGLLWCYVALEAAFDQTSDGQNSHRCPLTMATHNQISNVPRTRLISSIISATISCQAAQIFSGLTGILQQTCHVCGDFVGKEMSYLISLGLGATLWPVSERFGSFTWSPSCGCNWCWCDVLVT